ncbi:MAG: ABC transporter transmembrane domain-containing protein [Ignavibacteriales bacterium]|nr:ABC transporter transmembrane domain-containing protein [Ignavibacteriales bacterium]
MHFLIVGTSIIAGIFRYLDPSNNNCCITEKLNMILRGDFWEHIQKLPLRYFQNNSTGNIMAHATNDINAVRMFHWSCCYVLNRYRQ